MPVFDNLSLISILLMAVQFFIVVSVVIRVILTRHPPGSSFAWILLTVVLPYVGFFLYLMLGERPIGRLRARLLRHATHYWGRLSQVRSPSARPSALSSRASPHLHPFSLQISRHAGHGRFCR